MWWAEKQVKLQYLVDCITYAQTNTHSMDFPMADTSSHFCIEKRVPFSKKLKIPCNVTFFK